MRRLFSFIGTGLGALILGASVLQAESEPLRVGLIDFHSDDLDENFRAQLLDQLGSRVAKNRDFVLVSRSEINQTLLRPHPRAPERMEFFQKKEEIWKDLENLPSELYDSYLASQFEDVARRAGQAWRLVGSAGRNVKTPWLSEFLSLWAAALWFLEDEQKFSEVTALLYTLVPQADIAPRFPPEFMQELQRIRNRFEPRFTTKEVKVKPVSARIFLFDRVISYENSQLRLPEANLLSEVQVVVDAQEHLPQEFRLASFPDQVELESIAPERRVVGSLFSVLGRTSAPFALIEVGESVDADVVLLMNVKSEASGSFEAEAQWLEISTGRRSLVVESRSDRLESLMEILGSQLELLMRPSGRILSPTEAMEEIAFFRPSEERSAKLTDKWWFWTLVGVGVAGLGTGSYLLFKSDQNTQFRVVWE